MNVSYFLYVVIMAAISVISVEGFKSLCKPKNDIVRKTLYSIMALIPCFIGGYITTKLSADSEELVYSVIADGCIIYVIQYIFGTNLLDKLKQLFDKKIVNL